MTQTHEFGSTLKKKEGVSWLSAMARGFRLKCPRCGKGHLMDGYLKNVEECDHCGLNISGHQADDAPPYFTIMVVGHIVIPLALAHKQLFDPPIWVQFAVWTPILLLATALFLPRAKGALIALQWVNRLHGFADTHGIDRRNLGEDDVSALKHTATPQ